MENKKPTHFYFKRNEDCTPEELQKKEEQRKKAQQKGADANAAKAAINRNNLMDEALEAVLNEDPDAIHKINKRLLELGLNGDKADTALKALALFADINGTKTPRTKEQAEVNTPKTSEERQKILQSSGVKIISNDNS